MGETCNDRERDFVNGVGGFLKEAPKESVCRRR